jgi:hypothetical protein
LFHLRVNALTVRRDAAITENRHAGSLTMRLLFASIFCIAQPFENAGARFLCESLDFCTCPVRRVSPRGCEYIPSLAPHSSLVEIPRNVAQRQENSASFQSIMVQSCTASCAFQALVSHQLKVQRSSR